MRDDDCPDCPVTANTPSGQAARLARLAHEARFLEFALQGDTPAARALAAQLERALEAAMDADDPDELANASVAIEAALLEVTRQGMQLSAELSDAEIDGVLGRAKMPVLSAVLTAPDAPAP
jgi:hypothetical protein